jgi:hypothetical protein
MSRRDKKNEEETIKDLIEAEAEAALAQFRASKFKELLEKRIQLASTAPSRSSFFRLIPRPVWVSMAVLFLFGALLTYRFLRAPEPKASLTVENFLRQLPGMQAIEKEPRQVYHLISRPTSYLENGFAVVISNPHAQSGGAIIPRPDHGFLAINLKTEPMHLEELYGILIINKSVERVLTVISHKTKEGRDA